MQPVVDVNQIEARIGAAALNVICITYYNILALVAGSAAGDRGLTLEQIGFAASAFLAGLALINFAGFYWLRRFNWRRLVIVGNLLATAAFLIPVYNFSFEVWLACNLFAGLAAGLSFGVSIACLGDSNQPERNFAIAYLGQTFLSAGIIFSLPRISSSLDIFGLGHWIAAGLMLLGLGLTRLIPKRGVTRAVALESRGLNKTSMPNPARAALIMALGVLVLNVIAEGAVWTFLERIAVADGYDTLFAANVISASFFTAGAGSLLAAVIGVRFGRVKPFLLAVAASIISVVMFWRGGTEIVYIIAVLLFAAAWNLGSPYRMALATSADTTGQFATFVPAMQALGAAIGPAVAGMLIFGGSFSYVYLLSIVLWIVTVVLFLLASKRLNQISKGGVSA